MRLYGPLILLIASLGFMASLFASGSAGGRSEVRPSSLANSWYPGDPAELRTMLKNHLAHAEVPKVEDTISAIISPHAGYRFSGQAAAYGFKAIMGRDYDRVIIIAPSHYLRFRGISLSSYNFYETPLGRVTVDNNVGKDLSRHRLFTFQPEAEAEEHAVEIEIPFLQLVQKSFKIIPLIVGELEKDDFSVITRALLPHVTDKTLIVVSSDFTHFGMRFGYQPFRDNIKDNLKKLDMGAVDFILRKDIDGYFRYLQTTGITICGYLPIGILLGILPSDAKGLLLQYYTSGDLLGDYSSTVSYVSLLFHEPVRHHRENAGN
jgi:MEMO1 family protein